MKSSLRNNFAKLRKSFQKIKKKHLVHLGKSSFWFLIGVFFASFIVITLAYIFYQKNYEGKVYPGVSINGVDFGGKRDSEVKNFFEKKNSLIGKTTFVLNYEEKSATISAVDIDYGYDSDLLSKQAIDLGRSENVLSNMSIVITAYFSGINLNPSYRFSEEKLKEKIMPIAKEVNRKPVEALFKFENGRVTAFKPSSEGKSVDFSKIKEIISSKEEEIVKSEKESVITIQIPIKTIQPELTTDKANSLGIKELIGTGTSLFAGSIASRIYNINLAASRVNGVLIKPGEIFSFNKTIGDVSSFTGYKQAYVIQNGRTVLGDGGGVCQVSTTFFRAVLDAGMPVVERHAHAYRVHYYEEDSPPGIDATIYTPTVDFKFKNDSPSYILVQAIVDNASQRLTFYFYGQKDGRIVNMSTPVINSQTPPPEPKYEDDPSLPQGSVKQVDFAAWGANVSFTREVIKNGEKIISEQYDSNYRPWQAVYLRGTGQ